MKKLGAFGIAAAIVVLPHFAFAQPEQNNVQPVRLSYAADSDCPSKDDFVQAIRERGLSIREDDEAPRAISVTLVRDLQNRQWNGELRVHDAHGDASRTNSAASCADVARSIALFASLALTPESEAPVPPKPIPPPPAPIRNPQQNKPVHATPKTVVVEPTSLNRHRYSLGGEMIFSTTTRTFEDFGGVGLVGTYRLSDRFGLGLSLDALYSFHDYPAPETFSPGPGSAVITTPEATSNIALLRFMVRAPISLHVARGTFDGRPGSPFDFFLSPQVGTILTKPNNYPSQVPGPISPSLAFELDFGVRAFISTSLAITAAVGALYYEERYPMANDLYDSHDRLTSTTYTWSWDGNLGATFQLGVEFETPGISSTR